MRSLVIALVFGVLFTAIGFSQDKKEKGCCSSEKSKTTMSKICEVPDEVSLASDDKDKLVASINDDKDKKVEKNVKSMDKNSNKIKSRIMLPMMDAAPLTRKKPINLKLLNLKSFAPGQKMLGSYFFSTIQFSIIVTLLID